MNGLVITDTIALKSKRTAAGKNKRNVLNGLRNKPCGGLPMAASMASLSVGSVNLLDELRCASCSKASVVISDVILTNARRAACPLVRDAVLLQVVY